MDEKAGAVYVTATLVLAEGESVESAIRELTRGLYAHGEPTGRYIDGCPQVTFSCGLGNEAELRERLNLA